MSLLRVRLFGEPDVRIDGKTHAVEGPPRTLPLLAYLLLHRDSPQNRQAVANLFWPDVSEEEARANLRRHLHYIKQALPPLSGSRSWLDVTRNTVRWNPDNPYWLDVAEFEICSKSPKRREQAVELYRGDLFQRCDEEWIVYERERLRNLQLANLSSLANAAKESGALDRAITFIGTLIAFDPWREDAVRTAMELRANNGDRAGALSEFDRLRGRLREELDVEPMPETLALYEQIKKAAEHLPAAHGAAQSEIAGRESEMEALERCWRNALNSRADVVLIGGEAGCGKTTLVSWLSDVSRKSGATVLSGSAGTDRGSAFAEFADILRASRDMWQDRIPASSHALLAHLLPEIGEPVGRQSDDEVAEQLRLFTAIGDALEETAKHAPLLICLEDLHWAGETTVLLIEHLARRLQRRRVLIAGTYREEDVPPGHPLRIFRRRFARSPFFTHIALNNLREEDVLTMAGRALGEETAQSVLATLFRQSDGNPLMVRELLLGYKTHGHFAPGETLRAQIAARIDALEDSSRTVAQSAAVLGSTLDLDLVADLTGLAQRDLLAAVNDLCTRHILRSTPSAGGASYAFAHQLFADAAYNSATPAWKRSAHARSVLLLEAYYADDPSGNAATLAYHAERGELLRDASAWYWAAARRAHEIYANSEALSFADRALRLAQDRDQRYAALLLAEEVAQRLAARDRQRAFLRELRTVAEGPELPEVLSREIEFAAAVNDMQTYERTLAELERVAPGGPLWRARICWHKGVRAQRFAQVEDAVRELTQALELFHSLGEQSAEFRTRLALFDVALDHGIEASKVVEQMRQTAGGSSDPLIRARILLAESRLMLMFGDSPDCFQKAVELGEAAAEAGDRRMQALALLYQGAAAANMGDLQRARQHLAAAREQVAVAGSVSDQVRVALWEGIAELNVHNYTSALDICRKALALALEWSLYELALHLTNNMGLCYKNVGEFEEARATFKDALDLCDRKNLSGYRAPPLTNLGFMEFDIGNYAEAVRYLETVLDLKVPVSDEDALGLYGCLGVCHARLGNMERAKEYAALCERLTAGGGGHSFQQESKYWVCAVLSRLLGEDDAAERYVRIARDVLLEREQTIVDPEERNVYQAQELYGPIRAAAERDEWPADAASLALDVS